MSQPLRRLLVAQVPADMADWLDFVAIGTLLAFVWDAPPEAYAMLAVAMGLPYLVAGPVLAGIVDRADLRRVMIWSNLGRAIATVGLIIAQDWPSLLVAVAARATVDSAYGPAKQAAIQALAGEGELARVNGLSFGINQLSKVIVPSLGGALLLVMSIQQVFAINIAVSLLAAGLVMRLPRNLRDPAENEGTLRGLTSALRLVWDTAMLRRVFMWMGLAIFANFLFDTLFAPHFKSLDLGPQTLGYVITLVGAGTVIGAVIPLRDDPRAIMAAIAVAGVVAGIGVIAMGALGLYDVPHTMAALLAASFIVGVASGRSFLPMRVLLQTHTPPDKMARVAALSEATNTIALLSAPFLGAMIMRTWGTPYAFVAGGVMFIGLGVMVAVTRMRHRDPG